MVRILLIFLALAAFGAGSAIAQFYPVGPRVFLSEDRSGGTVTSMLMLTT
jgi:hypothetical protein